MIALITFIIFIIAFFNFNIEMVPYSVYLVVFLKYQQELNPLSLLVFYYFIVAYVYSSLLVTAHDLVTIVIKGDLKNA